MLNRINESEDQLPHIGMSIIMREELLSSNCGISGGVTVGNYTHSVTDDEALAIVRALGSLVPETVQIKTGACAIRVVIVPNSNPDLSTARIEMCDKMVITLFGTEILAFRHKVLQMLGELSEIRGEIQFLEDGPAKTSAEDTDDPAHKSKTKPSNGNTTSFDYTETIEHFKKKQ